MRMMGMLEKPILFILFAANLQFIATNDIANLAPSDNLNTVNFKPYVESGDRSKRESKKTLIDEPECKEDLRRLCGNLPTDSKDLYVLQCVQSAKDDDLKQIQTACQHQIWTHVMSVIEDENLLQSAREVCESDFGDGKLKCDKESGKEAGYVLTCLIESRETVSHVCRGFIQQVEWVAFSDIRTFPTFYKECEPDIQKYKCGRIQSDKTITQGKTLSCLQLKLDALSQTCQMQVLHLSEIQAHDVKLDRQLYLACTDDYNRFCSHITIGSGGVYKCLMEYKLDRTMSKGCQDQLIRRQKLIAQDYKVSHGLSRACKEDIKMFHCRRSTSDDKDIRLAQILTCLEGVMRNGTKISKDCEVEMVEHRQILMEDYRLSPEIVTQCSDDISRFCNGLEIGGKTIHCLMEHTRPKKRRERVSQRCQRSLVALVKQADAGEDWRVDPILREACKPVVDSECRELKGGDARVMACLMEKLGTPHMNEDCETALLQIQYFVARDFKLDPQLYRQCKEDAVRLCHAKRTWIDADRQSSERESLVLPCLYRYAYTPKISLKLKPECFEEIRRVMRQRAVSVDLQPEVEDVCLEDIALHCDGKTGKGEEMVCLQDNLEKLSPECKLVVTNYTIDEAGHVELNPVIMTYCKTVMEKHCEVELQAGNDEGDVMECLIKHKNDMDVRNNYKCRTAVEHFQLISMKNYHFTFKFKEACRPSVAKYCPTVQTMADVVLCLSEIIRNDTLKNNKQTVPKECRQQLRAQLFQQRENINFDPKLNKTCAADLENHCSGITKGAAQALECLKLNKDKLSNECHYLIFNVERQEMQDNSIDYTLITVCKQMINQFCGQVEQSQVLTCLKRNKNDIAFDSKCKSVVVRRMIEQNTDYRLNPMLQKSCRYDISKFCADIVATENKNKELNGKVINCLKEKFRHRLLSRECEREMTNILREAALNYELNPLLSAMCQYEINTMCASMDGQDTAGGVEECLKEAFNSNTLKNKACRIEVAHIIEEAKADIHVDPLLHQACATDITKFCSEIPQGDGRHLSCLQSALSDHSKTLQPNCEDMLRKRIEMFQNAAAMVAPETIGELYHTVSSSPSRKYFMIVSFTIVGLIFIMGLSCGRFSRRTLLMKNK